MLTVQHSMQKMTPSVPFLNKMDFILSFYCRLFCLRRAVIWWCLMVRMRLCAWRRRGGGVLRLNSWAVWKGLLSLWLNLMRWSMTLKIRIHNRERKKEWACWRLNGFTTFVCQLWSPFENVNCFWNMKSFFLIAEGWVFLWCCRGRQKQVWDSFSSCFQFWIRHWSTVSMRDWLEEVGFMHVAGVQRSG